MYFSQYKMLEKKTIVTIGAIISSAVIGYVMWKQYTSPVKKEEKCCDDNSEFKED